MCNSDQSYPEALLTEAVKWGKLEKAVERVRELHHKDSNGDCSVCVVDAQYGAKMYAPYPCSTIQALDSDQ
jgi:hypothetical protein